MPSHTAFYPFERLVNAYAEIPANGSLVTASGCIGLPSGYSGSASISKALAATTGTALIHTEWVRGGIYLKSDDTTEYTYSGTRTKLYGNTGAWFSQVDLSKVGGYGLNTTDVWKFIKWGSTVIATNYTNNIQVATIGSGIFADLGGSPPKARHMAVVGDFIVLGYVNDGTVRPNRLVWSGINSSTSWTAGTAQSDYQDLQGAANSISGIVGGDEGYIFTEGSIWRMRYVGPPVIMEFDEVSTRQGTSYSWSIVRLPLGIAFYTKEIGFCIFDGNGITNISKDIIANPTIGNTATDFVTGVSITGNGVTATATKTDHGFQHADIVYISDTSFSGSYNITYISSSQFSFSSAVVATESSDYVYTLNKKFSYYKDGLIYWFIDGVVYCYNMSTSKWSITSSRKAAQFASSDAGNNGVMYVSDNASAAVDIFKIENTTSSSINAEYITHAIEPNPSGASMLVDIWVDADITDASGGIDMTVTVATGNNPSGGNTDLSTSFSDATSFVLLSSTDDGSQFRFSGRITARYFRIKITEGTYSKIHNIRGIRYRAIPAGQR